MSVMVAFAGRGQSRLEGVAAINKGVVAVVTPIVAVLVAFVGSVNGGNDGDRRWNWAVRGSHPPRATHKTKDERRGTRGRGDETKQRVSWR